MIDKLKIWLDTNLKSNNDWKKDMQKIRDWCDKTDKKLHSGKYKVIKNK